MRILLIVTCLFLLQACEEKNSASARAHEIETFADPQIQAYKKAQQVQGVVDAQALEEQNEMNDSDIE